MILLGAGGRLGAALARQYAADIQGRITPLSRKEADLTQPSQIASLIKKDRPNVVINCAAMTNVDACESERERAEIINATTPGILARACTEVGARFIHVSTDYVFSGETNRPYRETDQPDPVSWYGETKLRGEKAVAAAGPRHAIVRVAWVFGPDRDSFIDKALQTALRGEPVKAVADKYSSPTYTLDVAEALHPLFPPLAPGGVYHVCNQGSCTWADWAGEAIKAAQAEGFPVQTSHVEHLKLADISQMVARRPVYSAMSCQKIERLRGEPMRPWQAAVRDYLRLLRSEGRLVEGKTSG